MTEMTMLELDQIDLGEIAGAMDDHSREHHWYLDPTTGDVHFRSDYDDIDDRDPDEEGWIPIGRTDSSEGYGDMEDFIDRVHDSHARDLLSRAIAGRGAFRRFKDTLFEFPELRQEWFALRDARANRRAVEWLLLEGLVDEQQGEQALERFADPEPPSAQSGFDVEEVLRDVVEGLRQLYGDRLQEVVLYGSYARGTADEESDVDVLVVLDRMESPYAEINRMGDLGWEMIERHGVVVSMQPFTRQEYEQAGTAYLQRVHVEGRKVA